MKSFWKYVAVAVVAVLLASFSTCDKGERVGPQPHSPPSVAAGGWAELPGLPGLPGDVSGASGAGGAGGVRYVTHWVSADGGARAEADTPGRVRNYTVAFDPALRQPLWVAYPMHPWYDGEAGRTDSWSADPYIPADEQPYLRRSYQPVEGGERFSRGHLLASDNRQRSRAMNAQTFYYTNSAPQTQVAFNAGIWLRLEELERELGFVANSDTLYVVTGSTFIAPLKLTMDDRGNVISAPSHFYKALLTTRGTGTGRAVADCSEPELQCVAFYLDHFGHGSGARVGAEQMMSIDDLERITGIDFFPMIPAAARAVEASFNAADWGL